MIWLRYVFNVLLMVASLRRLGGGLSARVGVAGGGGGDVGGAEFDDGGGAGVEVGGIGGDWGCGG